MTLVVPVMLAAVGERGRVAAQLALVRPARLVTPMVMVHEAVPLAIVTPLKATVSGVPCVGRAARTAGPEGDGRCGRGPAQGLGRLSVKAMPDCAGLVPLLVSVKIRLVVAPSLMVELLQALVGSARDGVDHHALTGDRVGHVGRAGDVGRRVGEAAARAGGVGQARPVGHPGNRDGARGRRWPSSPPLKATVSGVPCVTTLVPAQPAPKVMVGVAQSSARTRADFR